MIQNGPDSPSGSRLRWLVALVAIAGPLAVVVVWLDRGVGEVVESSVGGSFTSTHENLRSLRAELAQPGLVDGEFPSKFGVTAVRSAALERPSEGSLLFGLAGSNRIAAIPLTTILRGFHKGSPLRAELVSQIVGAPEFLAVRGTDTFLVTDRLSGLVRLRDWRGPEELPVKTLLRADPDSVVEFGPIIPWRDSLLVAAGFSRNTDDSSELRVAVLEIDPERFRVRRVLVLDHRTDGAPLAACVTSDGVLGVIDWDTAVADESKAHRLDLVDPARMRRLGTVALRGYPTSLACVGEEFWTGYLHAGNGEVIGSDGRIRDRFAWGGQTSDQLYFDPAQGRLYGIDSRDFVFACHPRTRRCKKSKFVGGYPEQFVLVGRAILVRIVLRAEGETRLTAGPEGPPAGLALLDARTLRVRGTIPFPLYGRGLAYVP